MKHTEVCIIGGGLVGLTAAIAFSRQGRSVSLLEATNLKRDEPPELDARSIALSYSSVQILRSLGLWQSLQPQTAAISTIHVSSAGHFGVTRLNAEDVQLDAMGYVIEYHILVQSLLLAVKHDSRIEIISPARLESLDQHNEGVTINYQLDGQRKNIQTALMVVADGAGSTVREQLGIAAETMDYQQTAIIANVKVQQPSTGYAYERFTNDGPLALLPLPNQRYAMVWSNPPARADALMQLSDEDFVKQIYRSFGFRLGYFSQLGSRVRFDLKLTRAQQLVSGRAVLIGNAANTLHPVAGQGFNLALRDVSLLFDRMAGIDLQSDQLPSQLLQYEEGRASDQNQAVQMGNGLVQLFSNKLPVLNHLRAAALVALDLCPVMKKEVSWQGMGYGPGCSSLMRGRIPQ